MEKLDRKAVVGDIGANHVRFAIADIDELNIDHYAIFRTDRFASAGQALSAYLRSLPAYPDRLGIAASGGVDKGPPLSNHPGRYVDEDELLAIDGIASVMLLDGAEALATALPLLGTHDVVQLGGQQPLQSGVKIVIGAGNSLGIAALVPVPGGWSARAGLGGNIAFPACDRQDIELVDAMKSGIDFVSVEHVLSASGLAYAHAIRLEKAGISPAGMTAEAIIAAANSGDDQNASATLADFSTRLGRFAGDIALLFNATGGLYLAGGIPPLILHTLQNGGFRRAFADKGKATDFLADLPVFVIRAQDASLRGVAMALSNQQLGEDGSL